MQDSSGSTSAKAEIFASTNSGCVAGIDLGGTNLRVAISDMKGKSLAKWSCSIVGIRDANRIIDLICDGVNSLLEKRSLSRDALRAAGVGVPGIIDVDHGRVIATSYLMGWRDIPLTALLEAKLNVPVSIDNDVNVAAIGESRAGAALGAADFVFLAIGTGIGAGIVLNRQLYRGHAWMAGEVGYMLVPGVSETPAESSAPGALEMAVGGEGIKAQWRSRWSEGRSALPIDASATEIFDSALISDVIAQEVLQHSARTLAYAIYNICLVLNCPLFVLGGGVGVHPALGQAIRDVLRLRNTRAQPKVVSSSLGTEAQLMGAIYMAIEAASARP